MAQLGVNFDASRVQPYEAGLPVWEGRIPCTIMKTEIKATAANDGNNMLLLHVKAIDAPYTGQDQVIRLNLYNRSPQAVDIAQRQLSSICHVTGKMTVTDSDQLVGVPFIGRWEKETRELTDQTTGLKRSVDGCQCRDYAFIDGRTIKEAMAGQPASSPYIPGQSGVQEAAMRGGSAPAPAHNPAPPAAAPQGAAPGGQPGFQPPQQQPAAAPQAGFVPPTQSAPAPAFGQQAPAAGGFGTAASPSSGPQGGFAPPPPGGAPQGGFNPPAAPQAGAGPWGGAPQGAAPAGSFGPR